MGNSFDKGFVSGFVGGFAGGGLGYLGASGILAASVAGGISSGTGSVLNDHSLERTLTNIFMGAIIGGAMGEFIPRSVEVNMDMQNIPWLAQSLLQDDVTWLAEPVLGTIGSDIWACIDSWLFD